MASIVQEKLKKVKPSAKNVVEKYKDVFDQVVRELKHPDEQRQGLEAFIGAGEALTTLS